MVSRAQKPQIVAISEDSQLWRLYLLFKARGQSIDDFLAIFSEHSYVENDDNVGDLLKEIIQAQIKLSE